MHVFDVYVIVQFGYQNFSVLTLTIGTWVAAKYKPVSPVHKSARAKLAVGSGKPN